MIYNYHRLIYWDKNCPEHNIRLFFRFDTRSINLGIYWIRDRMPWWRQLKIQFLFFELVFEFNRFFRNKIKIYSQLFKKYYNRQHWGYGLTSEFIGFRVNFGINCFREKYLIINLAPLYLHGFFA